MKGEILMMNFKEAKAQAMNGVGKHSTLITFVLATLGVGASIYLASKEIPKAKAEVKEILEKEDLTKAQKATESVKAVAKSTWKTAVVALGTILLVTGTSAITAANTAATVAGLTNTINLVEQKYKDATEAIEQIPDKKVKEQVQREIGQKTINRATTNIHDDYFAPDERCRLMYVWTDSWTGVTFKATMDMVENAAKITDARFGTESYQTINDFYNELIEQGAIFMDERMPQLIDEFAWQYTLDFDTDVYVNDKGWTIHTIHYATPSRDF
jgi:hypothetical protein